ncbi:prephenate dehydrogenase [Pseudoclavibacter sp. CFCC 13796]|uniref:prephenate dehydrogenase n=1 Tax=Pseudoclavibacter sp. CFCC 13796 TaxID=2615179 RepID=UPI00130159B6|nr:prephenate dehydrogenase [Pseudoclavibacter sp. CFCC 13796]KAB1661975.1 prephenate dehydrogenase [Pseudoclavibacter sp. CFCC 13796]
MSISHDLARTPSPVLIIGTGLLGASIGLALMQRGVEVLLSDISPSALALAADYGAGRALADGDQPVLVVVAVPPEIAADAVAEQLRRWPDAVVTDVTSVKAQIVRALIEEGADLDRYLGSHPMAGRERGGPISARADLFRGQPWVIAEHKHVTAHALETVERLALDVEAVPVHLDPVQHDRAVALISHVPQVVATLLAGRLVDGTPSQISLAGQGLRDTTRIAASDPGLWLQILAANSDEVTSVLRALRDDLDAMIHDLEDVDRAGARREITELFIAGNTGVRRIPGKHGTDAEFSTTIVFVDDRPGELARLFAEIGEIGVNIEDLRLEHSPKAEFGLAEVSVLPERIEELTKALKERGWRLSR